MVMPKTPKEVEALKDNWRHDPCFDLEDYPGFEDYHDELLAYRKETEAHWELERQREHDKFASMYCPMMFMHESLSDAHCQVEKCAWWRPGVKCCSMQFIGATGTI